MLVSYSDSEGSDGEQEDKPTPKPAVKPTAPASQSSFAVDRSTGKIKVNLQNKPDPSASGTHEDEPAAKRPRLGGSNAFTGFNAMLPAPKRDSLPPAQNGSSKASTRKVFSLRTGAEPAFSRESDAELRELFNEQNTNGSSEQETAGATIPPVLPKPSFAKPAPPAPAGKPMMFKPLSVARNTKKKKQPQAAMTPASIHKTTPTDKSAPGPVPPVEQPKKQKINLFSAGTDTAHQALPADEEDEIVEDLGPIDPDESLDSFQDLSSHTEPTSALPPGSQSLDSIASDLNLSAADRRQLFGRAGRSAGSSAINVVNFNTDAEYAANQRLAASGEQVQHNPVRAIASGKHSLRQLVSSAANQKEALEESFAAGKRNKKEAGNKYGW